MSLPYPAPDPAFTFQPAIRPGSAAGCPKPIRTVTPGGTDILTARNDGNRTDLELADRRCAKAACDAPAAGECIRTAGAGSVSIGSSLRRSIRDMELVLAHISRRERGERRFEPRTDALICRGRVDHRRSRHAIAPRSCDQPDPAAAREPSQLSTWPDGKTITESNRVLAHLCKISIDLRGRRLLLTPSAANRTTILLP